MGESTRERNFRGRAVVLLVVCLLHGAAGGTRVPSIDATPIPLLENESRSFVVGLLRSGLDTWQPTFASYLTETAGQKFAPPLSFSVVSVEDLDLQTHQVDFLFVGPTDFSCLNFHYNAIPLAVLRNFYTVGSKTYTTTQMGGVLFTNAERGDVNSISDFQGRSMGAASITSLVSGQVQFGVSQPSGLSFLSDLSQAVFTGSETEVVKLVERGDVDIGFVRAGELERIDAEGTRRLSQFKIIHSQDARSHNPPFPFHVSTQLLPEWTLASLDHVPWMVQAHVQRALISMSTDSPAAVAAHYEGWRTPLSLPPITSLQAQGFELGDESRASHSRSCLRSNDLYQNILCPEGDWKKSQKEILNGCASAGLACPVGMQCVCQPCQRGFDVDVFPTEQKRNPLYSADLEADKTLHETSACARMSLCSVTQQQTPFSLSIVDRLQRPNPNISMFLHSLSADQTRPTITSVAPFEYKAELRVNVIGTHVMEIAVDGTPISQSPIRVTVQERDCSAEFGPDSLLAPTDDGECVCKRSAFSLRGSCVEIWRMVVFCLFPITGLVGLIFLLYRRQSQQRAQGYWRVDPAEIKWSEPREILGRGSFGLILKAEYRGTTVAVKRVTPQPCKRRSAFSLTGLTGAASSSAMANGMDSASTAASNFSAGATPLAHRGSGGAGAGATQDRTYQDVSTHELDLHLAEEVQELELQPEVDSAAPTLAPYAEGGWWSVSGWFLSKLRFESRIPSDFRREMQVISRLRHPCITTVMGAVVQPDQEPLLILEYMDHGSLYELLHNDTVAVDGEIIVPIIRDIAQGLRFLHAADPPLVHGDVKSQNILVEGSTRFRAKVTDFGFSHMKTSGLRGSPFFMPPEVLNGETPTSAADVYAFAVLLCEVYGRSDPYEGQDSALVLEQVKDTSRYPPKRCVVPYECPTELSQLIKECWDNDKDMRPNFREIDRRLRAMSAERMNPKPCNSNPHSRSTSMRRGSILRTRSVAFNQAARCPMTNLLSDVFPKHIAEALTAGRKVEPERREMVTIFFSDIVGFTNISSEVEPEKIAHMLDRLYTRFDALSCHYGVFKVETIGDAYMAVTNLVEPQPDDHAIRIARFALAAVSAARETPVDIDEPSLGFVNIRVGFHSGPVVANVVGTRNPRYCLFGDTVNTASRMESHSEAGRVHMSQAAARQVRKQDRALQIERRGLIDVKGKGMMKTYWLTKDRAVGGLDQTSEESSPAQLAGLRTSSAEGLYKRKLNKAASLISRLASIEPDRTGSWEQAESTSRAASTSQDGRTTSDSALPHELAVLVHMRTGSVHVDDGRLGGARGGSLESIATMGSGSRVAASFENGPTSPRVISGSSESIKYV